MLQDSPMTPKPNHLTAHCTCAEQIEFPVQIGHWQCLYCKKLSFSYPAIKSDWCQSIIQHQSLIQPVCNWISVQIILMTHLNSTNYIKRLKSFRNFLNETSVSKHLALLKCNYMLICLHAFDHKIMNEWINQIMCIKDYLECIKWSLTCENVGNYKCVVFCMISIIVTIFDFVL